MKKTKIIICRPGEPGFVTEITPDYNILTRLVGGPLQETHPIGKDVAILANEEGKLMGRLPNRFQSGKHAKKLIEKGFASDVYAGTVVIIGSCDKGYVSLTDDQIELYMDIYGEPEFIYDWALDEPERSECICRIQCM